MKAFRLVLCCAVFFVLFSARAEDNRPKEFMAHVAVPDYTIFIDAFGSGLTEITKDTQYADAAMIVPTFAQMLPPFAQIAQGSRLDVVITDGGQEAALIVTGTKMSEFPIREKEGEAKIVDVMGMPLYVDASGERVVMGTTADFAQATAGILEKWSPTLSGQGQIIVGVRMEEGRFVSALGLDQTEIEQRLEMFLADPNPQNLPSGMSTEDAKELVREFKELVPGLMEDLKKVTETQVDIHFGESSLTVVTTIFSKNTDTLIKAADLVNSKGLVAADIKAKTEVKTVDGGVAVTVSGDYADVRDLLQAVQNTWEDEGDAELEDAA